MLCFVHFQSFSESSSCVEELQVNLLMFMNIFLCICSETQESSALYGGVIGGVVGVLIIVMIILGERKVTYTLTWWDAWVQIRSKPYDAR